MNMPPDPSMISIIPAPMMRTALQTDARGVKAVVIVMLSDPMVGYAVDAAGARQIAASLMNLADELEETLK